VAQGVGPESTPQDRKKKKKPKPEMVAYTYNPSIWEAEAGGSKVPGQPGLYNKTLFQTQKTKKKWRRNTA
jgi:hypothetical protein